MKHEFSTELPLLRLACAVAAVAVTLSIGGFIDFLSMGYAVVEDTAHSPAITAERKPLPSSQTEVYKGVSQARSQARV